MDPVTLPRSEINPTLRLLLAIASGIDALSLRVGRVAAWFGLLMILVQFAVVVMRYVFGVGSIWAQESILYMHSIVFMLGAAYTLCAGGHVRVDIFYASASKRTQALINLIGSVLFLLPFTLLLSWFAFPYVLHSWEVMEGSREASGIQGVYLLKTLIMLMAAMLFLQGLAIGLRSFLVVTGVLDPDDPRATAETDSGTAAKKPPDSSSPAK